VSIEIEKLKKSFHCESADELTDKAEK